MNIDSETIGRIWSVGMWLTLAFIVAAKFRHRRRAERRAGHVLIDCGRNTQGTLILIGAGLYFVLAIASQAVGDSLAITIWAAIAVLLFFPDCLYRVRLCENAILHNGPMIEGGHSVPWLNITAIEWTRPWQSGVMRATLTLRDARGLRGIAGNGVRFTVPESQVAEVERLILEKSGAEVRDAAYYARGGSTSPSPR